MSKNNNYWTLWFHSVDDNNWSIEDYTKIMELSNLDDLLYCIKKLQNITAGMFFVMKNDIKPLWEDSANINGGFWTFKISKLKSNDLWKNILYNLITNNITKNKLDMNIITGISCSPKINNCIFKIWNNNSKKSDINIISPNIENLILSEAIYRKHHIE